MGLCHVFVKYVLFLINLIFTLVGLALVVIGVLIHFQSDNVSLSELELLEVPSMLNYLAIAIIVFGCIVFLIAFAGCCGAVTETRCLLLTFASIIVLLIAAKTYLLIVWNKEIYVLRNAANETLQEIHYYNDPPDNVTFHGIEALLKCCGKTGPEEYETLPPTCCGATEINYENLTECKIEDAFVIGCVDLVDDFIAGVANLVRTILLGIVVLEALEVVSSVYLFSSINRRRRKRNNVYRRY